LEADLLFLEVLPVFYLDTRERTEKLFLKDGKGRRVKIR
jgi:hypothetical protein